MVATAGLSRIDFNRDGFPTGLPGSPVTFQADTTPVNLAARHCVTLSLTGRREVLPRGSGTCT